MKKSPIEVLAYYFPNWHVDPLNEQVHGSNWTEWSVVQCARPRFAGHRQPRIPLWGYEDESRSDVMAKKISCAAEHGITGFIFDWYYSESGPFRQKALNEGFLKAENCKDFKFSLMWCNHSRSNFHPTPYTMNVEMFDPPLVSPEKFEEISDVLVNDYFVRDNYLKFDDRAYFSIYSPHDFLRSFGSVKAAADALDRLRAKAVRAGLNGIFLHFNYLFFRQLHERLSGERKMTADDPLSGYKGTIEDLNRDLGLNCSGSYTWGEVARAHEQFPAVDAELVRQQVRAFWAEGMTKFGLPYHPIVATGWDPSPRTIQSDSFDFRGYPWVGVWEQSPREFGAMLEIARKHIEVCEKPEERVITLGSWNEWTEGCYLEPDTVYGLGYLKEVQKIFKETN